MLQLAAKARLPLIFARSQESSSYLGAVLSETIGEEALKFTKTPLESDRVYYSRTVKDFPSRRALFDLFEAAGSSLITVDADDSFPGAVEVGEVATPTDLLVKAIEEAHGKPDSLLRAVKGCTVIETINLLKMTQVREGKLDFEGISKMRRDLVQPTQGLTVIDTKDAVYVAPKRIAEWEDRERHFFGKVDHRLAPRGLLLYGPPGTGKTAASKWLAQKWGLPLFRLDIGGTKNMFVGNSEKFLREAIFRVEQAAPCIVLLDEIEKMFTGSYQDSTTMSMASYLLWWLSEHRAQVLTVMTCNNKDVLRPELYREGRLDGQIEFPNLESMTAVVEFAKLIFASYDMNTPPDILAWATKLKSGATETWSHAKVIETVKQRVKSNMLNLLTQEAN